MLCKGVYADCGCDGLKSTLAQNVRAQVVMDDGKTTPMLLTNKRERQCNGPDPLMILTVAACGVRLRAAKVPMGCRSLDGVV